MVQFNSIILDPRNEDQLTQEAKIRAFQLSGGVLNSQLEGDPLDVFIRTQAYVGAELLFYVNQLPLAFALKFLESTGGTKAEGTKAVVTLQFTLISPRTIDFTVPANFEVTGQSSRGVLSFFTKEALVIPAGETVGAVDAEAADIGPDYNLSAGRIRTITRPLAFLKGVTNPAAAQGGRSPESDQQYLDRAVARLRRRAPVSKTDYEEYAEEAMGYGSRAVAVGLLGRDKVTVERGAVHLFLMAADGSPASAATQRSVETYVNQHIQLGTRLYVSPATLLPIACDVIARLEDGADPELVADNLWDSFQEFVDPVNFPEGGSVYPDELSHQLRFAGGISYLDTVLINEDFQPIAMPNIFTLPTAWAINCQLVDSNGNAFNLARGSFD